jgi:hypothetical protein
MKLGVEEYDGNKTLIQRTYLTDSIMTVGTQTFEGAANLSSTTRYIVVICDVPVSAGGGGPTKLDAIVVQRVPQQYHAYIYRNAATQVVATATDVQIIWDTDQGQVPASGWWTSGSGLVLPAHLVGRDILIQANVRFASNATGDRRLRIWTGGTTAIAENIQNAVSGVDTIMSISALDLAAPAGRSYSVAVFQTSGGNLNVVGGFQATFIRITAF